MRRTLTYGFKYSSGDNYSGDDSSMVITFLNAAGDTWSETESAYGYCMIAQSQSEKYFMYSSPGGLIESATEPTCPTPPTTP